MSKHKKQHFVAQSYLRAWCDPETPADQEPYVWRFSKDGTNARRKAPENIFYETDLYTITMPDGGRNLRLGHGLSQLNELIEDPDHAGARNRRPRRTGPMPNLLSAKPRRARGPK